MSDIEQRLRDALDARADLVRLEDLNLSPALEPSEPEAGPWWQRPSVYLFVAAVAVIVVALPLLALAATDPDGDKEPVGPATNPTGTATMTDPAPMQVDQDDADVDGDGTPDRIRVTAREAPEAVLADYRIDVELSSTGATASHRIRQVGGVKLGATVNLDGRRGEDIVVGVDPETVDLHRAAPVVLSLRDGQLASILADDLGADGRPGSDGTRTYWWVHDGQLWWCRSQRPVAEDEQSPYAVDVLRFPREPMLRGVDHGTWCVTSLAATRLLDCEPLD